MCVLLTIRKTLKTTSTDTVQRRDALTKRKRHSAKRGKRKTTL